MPQSYSRIIVSPYVSTDGTVNHNRKNENVRHQDVVAKGFGGGVQSVNTCQQIWEQQPCTSEMRFPVAAKVSPRDQGLLLKEDIHILTHSIKDGLAMQAAVPRDPPEATVSVSQ